MLIKQALVMVILSLALSFNANSRTITSRERLNNIKINATRLFHNLNYAGALNLFFKAYDQDPNDPVLVWNIARCYEELRAYRKAMNYFRIYLAMVSDPLLKRRAADKIKRLKHINKCVVDFHVSPKDARVFINDHPYDPSGGPLSLSPGTYRIQVVREGYKPYIRTIRVTKGEVLVFKVDLANIPGILLLVTRPSVSYAEVLIDGKLQYQGPLPRKITCPPGRHLVTVRRAAGFRVLSERIDVPSGGVVRLQLIPGTAETDMLDNIDTSPLPLNHRILVKRVLSWTGFGLLMLGGALHLWGYIQYRNNQTGYNLKYYTAYGLYGVGGCLLITGIALPGPERSEWSLSPSPSGFVLGVTTQF